MRLVDDGKAVKEADTYQQGRREHRHRFAERSFPSSTIGGYDRRGIANLRDGKGKQESRQIASRDQRTSLGRSRRRLGSRGIGG
jgi:hypothetical protein